MSALSEPDALTLAEAARIMREAVGTGTVDGKPVLWIYAVQADGYGGDIKVGIAKDPIARLRTLQVGSALPLRGIGAWPGTIDDERHLHEMYAGLRIRGEWFAHSLPLYRLIRDLGGDFRWER